MGKTDATEATEDDAMLKGPPRRRTVGTAGGWKQIFLCCVTSQEDDVRELDYQHASLTDVPAEIFNHERTLEILRLDCNQISELPRPLFHCHGLKELLLADNEISTLPPALASLIHLEVLDVSKNALAEVPDAISGLKSLIVLDLSVNPLGKLPEGATKLLALESLNLSDTFLEFLPANFGRLTKLRHLELRENQLATLPKSMARLTALRRLDLGQNELSDVPEVVGSIPSLTELWLDGNKLDVLPDLLGQLPNLVHLDASRNSLHGIAPSIGLCKSLSDLSLTSNNLASLPEELGDLSQLTVLRVDDNRLTSLPDSIGRLTQLEELQASQNRLSNLPASIGLLRQLQTLMLNENQLEELPAELGSCQRLTVLSARKNLLDRLPPELGQLSRLRVVNVSCNRLPHLPVSLLKLQPTLTALWLSEAQTKPVVPLQTDTDPGTGHKVLTCFLLPQTAEPEQDQQQLAKSTDKESPIVSPVRTPTHIKFAFDGEADHRAGRLMRNPTPYPKELKALAKHAQHIQQHQPTSRSNSLEIAETKKAPPSSPVVVQVAPVTPLAVATPSVPMTVTSVPVEPSIAVVSKLSSSSSEQVTMRPKAELPKEAMQPAIRLVDPESPPAPSSPPPHEEPRFPPPILVAQSPVSNRLSMVSSTVSSPEPSNLPQEIEIKEARVMRPLKSSVEDEPIADPEPSSNKQQPPPYHVAAAYSKRAAEFAPASSGSLPRSQSTDSGFTAVDGVAGSKPSEADKRDMSPSRDSGRGPSIEPLEESQPPAAPQQQPPPPPVPLPPKRPMDLPLNGLFDTDKVTPLMIKRATFIVESSSSSPPPVSSEEPADLQSVAALRQAAREVFLASPKQSPLPSHRPSTNWDGQQNNVPLSAANVIGLPDNHHQQHTTPTTSTAVTKVTGRLPAPKYHAPSTIVPNNGHRNNNETPTEPNKPSLPSSTSSSRIPRLPSTGLTRQLSGVANDTAPALPPKQQSSSPPLDLPPPTLLPKLSAPTATSRIPPPTVLSPPGSRTSFSPLPVHSARMITPTSTVPPSAINNNEESPSQLNSGKLSGTTRIPLPKYSSTDVPVVVPVTKTIAGPSPSLSRIPTRLPTPTSALPVSKTNRMLPTGESTNDRSSPSSALAARTQ